MNRMFVAASRGMIGAKHLGIMSCFLVNLVKVAYVATK